MLLPALKAYKTGDVLVVLIFSNLAPRRHGKPLLCGLVPLELRRRGPVRVLRLWHYIHCYLGTPLIRAEFGAGVLQAFFEWLAEDSRGAPLLELGRITGDGRFQHLLVDHLRQHQCGYLLVEAFTRAFLRHDDGSLIAQVSSKKCRKLRRAEMGLASVGKIAYTSLAEGGDIESWLADFLRLEASGWKRQAGTALICRDNDRQFFLEVVRAAFERRRLMMLSLTLDGTPIAHLCNFLAGDGSFAFKVAFDESCARHSPGALLELENLRQVEASPGLRWMDSCTDSEDQLIKHLWSDRRIIHTVLIETGRAPGPVILGVLPLWRWLRRRFGGLFWGRKMPPE